MPSRQKESNPKEKGVTGFLNMSLALVIANLVVHCASDQATFQLVMPHGDLYYQFHEVAFGLNLARVILIFLAGWMSCVGIASSIRNDNDDQAECCFGSAGAVAAVGLLISFIVDYWNIGRIWHVDPKHTMLWYSDFWSQGITHQPNVTQTTLSILHSNTTATLRGANATLPPDHVVMWPYVTSDVVVRIYGFYLMLLTVIGGLVCCCGSTAWCAGR